MNVVAAGLLIGGLSEEDAFYQLCWVVDCLLPACYTPSMAGTALECKVFDHLLKFAQPRVAAHLPFGKVARGNSIDAYRATWRAADFNRDVSRADACSCILISAVNIDDKSENPRTQIRYATSPSGLCHCTLGRL